VLKVDAESINQLTWYYISQLAGCQCAEPARLQSRALRQVGREQSAKADFANVAEVLNREATLKKPSYNMFAGGWLPVSMPLDNRVGILYSPIGKLPIEIGEGI